MTIETGVTGYTPESQRDKAISSLLNPNFADTIKHEGVYHIEAHPEIMSFCREIESMGGRALLVGGCVRDSIIGLTPKDYDVEVYGITPEQILDTLRTKYGVEPNLEGKEFEVIKWKIPGLHELVDVSIPRRDSKKKGQKGHKAFDISGDPGMSIADASLRRDITINSLAYDPLTETLYDPHGGISDIENKIIRITDAKTFIEDSVRVLRVMQFSARFAFDITEETLALCTQMVAEGELDYVTRERVMEEMMKIFSKGKEPSRAFEFARKIGFVEKYWPELHVLIGLKQNKIWHPEEFVWEHTMQGIDAAAEIADREIASGRMSIEDRSILISAALCHDLGKAATTEFVSGAFRSYGHEQAGVEPTRVFLERFLHNQNSTGIVEFTAKVLPLVAEHLKPKEMWINEIQRGISQKKALHSLAKRLAFGDETYPDGHGANIYLLSLLAEADQRGRDPSGHFSARESVFELVEWQTWLNAKMAEDKMEKAPPSKILSAALLLKEVGRAKGGPWVGIIINAVQLEWMEGNIGPEQALESGKLFYERLMQKIASEIEASGRSELEICSEWVFYEDPRVILQ